MSEVLNTEIYDTISGELIDTANVDQLIDRLEAHKQIVERLQGTINLLRRTLASLSSGEAVTRRVCGARRLAKVVMPDESFDQRTLKELWAGFPEVAPDFLRVASLDVRRREYAKLINTSSSVSDFMVFREQLMRANQGRIGTPRIEIER